MCVITWYRSRYNRFYFFQPEIQNKIKYNNKTNNASDSGVDSISGNGSSNKYHDDNKDDNEDDNANSKNNHFDDSNNNLIQYIIVSDNTTKIHLQTLTLKEHKKNKCVTTNLEKYLKRTHITHLAYFKSYSRRSHVGLMARFGLLLSV